MSFCKPGVTAAVLPRAADQANFPGHIRPSSQVHEGLAAEVRYE